MNAEPRWDQLLTNDIKRELHPHTLIRVPKSEQDTDRFDSPSPEEQNLNDSMRGLSLVHLQNLNPTVVDTYRIAILETVGF
ncbi:uncharacterized protein N7503_007761 [Penicillium pulvis]|uniref:uncharacterized protein n=1 Tax=Penicillium pulvis TaxID=1562058 RepID=UPI0025467781|nr:uncharacterized protein N7503_007761 [Penicillium pulvis]KAJ5798465.1 hypothetical protein N7503_007761 [Penicillium pulvis]